MKALFLFLLGDYYELRQKYFFQVTATAKDKY